MLAERARAPHDARKCGRLAARILDEGTGSRRKRLDFFWSGNCRRHYAVSLHLYSSSVDPCGRRSAAQLLISPYFFTMSSFLAPPAT